MNFSSNLLGVHLSSRNNFCNLFFEASKLNIFHVQCFTASNVRWVFDSSIKDEVLEKFFITKKKYPKIILYSHASYLINLSSSDEELRKKSVKALEMELSRSKDLHIEAVTVHCGSRREGGWLEGGLGKSICEIAEKIVLQKYPRLLLENSSGAGSMVMGSIEQIQSCFDFFEKNGVIGIGCTIDTCHAHAYGYDFSIKESQNLFWNSLFAAVDRHVIALIHCNDSKGRSGSKIDRHANIGHGSIGLEGFSILMKNNNIKKLVKILETPYASLDDYSEDIKRLNQL